MYKLFNIGLLGYGHIGHGIDQIVTELSKRQPMVLTKIFDIQEKSKEIGTRYCSSIDEIIDDPNIDIVIEAMGGNTFAFECIKQALKAKKHVVTSNKEVVAIHLKELLTLAHENEVYFLFEASCCGGIPLINPLIELTKYDTVLSLRGVLSSSTNVILTKMQDEKLSFYESIYKAQEMGILEKDYQRDLLGIDLADKISILASLSFSTRIDPNKVPLHGIQNINDNIIKDINSKRLYLKFVAEARLIDNKLQIGVEPIIVSKYHSLVSIKDDFNDICVILKNSNKLQFAGKGSGSLPASSAIASDLIRIIEDKGYINNIDINNYEIVPYSDEKTNYYVYKDGKGEIIPSTNIIDFDEYQFYARIVNY